MRLPNNKGLFFMKYYYYICTMIYYFSIGVLFTFIMEVSARYYADKIMIIKDDEPFREFSMLERIFIITIWPVVVLMFLTILFRKDDEV